MQAITIVVRVDRALASSDVVPSAVGWVEVGPGVDAAALRDRTGAKLLGDLQCARDVDYVKLEPRDLSPRVLARIPAEKRVIVDRGVAPDIDELLFRAAHLTQTPAALYVL